MIRSLGGDAEEFAAYANGPCRAEHDAIIDEAERMGVFGVPMFVLDGELFWGGDRIALLSERIEQKLQASKAAAGSAQ